MWSLGVILYILLVGYVGTMWHTTPHHHAIIAHSARRPPYTLIPRPSLPSRCGALLFLQCRTLQHVLHSLADPSPVPPFVPVVPFVPVAPFVPVSRAS
jgi:hypothetical protein